MSFSATPPYEIVTTCLRRDLPIFRLAAAQLQRLLPVARIVVATRKVDVPYFRQYLDDPVEVIDEGLVIPSMNLFNLRELSLPCFPRGAGWYFQQLLKLGFVFHSGPSFEHYIIWDADTILLRPLEFIDSRGRMIFTKAEEYHAPYFANYRKLLGHEPRREFSFISQHIIVNKTILREMLAKIESRIPGDDNWAWKIMRSLTGDDANLFSEYEVYGHYVKNIHPSQATFRDLPWTRNGTRLVGSNPSAGDLTRLADKYAFAAFEASQQRFRKTIRALKGYFRRLLRNS